MTITAMDRALERNAVIDPDTCTLVVPVVHLFQSTFVPIETARQMIRDADTSQFVAGQLVIHIDGKRYQFPEVTAS